MLAHLLSSAPEITIVVGIIFWLITTTNKVAKLISNFQSMDEKITAQQQAEKEYVRMGFEKISKAIEDIKIESTIADFRIQDLEGFLWKEHNFKIRRYTRTINTINRNGEQQ